MEKNIKELIYKNNSFYLLSKKTNEYNKLNFSLDKNLFLKDSKEVLQTFRKKLQLNGLGYKMVIVGNKMQFKLNLSHNLEIEIPSYISKVSQRKNLIIFESKDKIMLGNFVRKIYQLRPCNAYKYKGFLFEDINKKLKEVKKK